MKHEEKVKKLREIYKNIGAPKGFKKKICTNPYGPPNITIYEAKAEIVPAYDDAGEEDGETTSQKITATIEFTQVHVLISVWEEEPKSFKIPINDANLIAKIKKVIFSACKNS